ncbi:MAG TPA: helix-turn-helix transcriptional regulator [Terriglobia bacterium]|nr:helix-turn-helix transcriptional regulator [Terriglobia bacterium]
MNLGESIRKIRQSKGLSQGEMQKRTGILRSYLSRVENGHTIPSLATLQRLASAMDVALADFFAAEGETSAAVSAPGDAASQYLGELKNYLPQLSAQQRQELLEMVKEMAHAVRRS